MNTASKLSLTLVALMAVGVSSAQAQASAQINATATVQTPLSLTGVNPLAFGNVFPGLTKTILPTDATAGKFSIAGQASAEVNITFTLPTNLVSGANNLPIGTWTGGRNIADVQAGQTALTPTAATITPLSGTGGLFIWLGATVTPAVAQVAGAYSSPVTMTVAYTGN